MFAPSRCNRSWFLMITLAVLAGCAEEGGLVGPEELESLALGRGGGGGPGRPLRVENLDSWNMAAWVPSDHKKLGLGYFEVANVSHDAQNDRLLLALPQGTTDGAEIRSASRVAFRDIEIRMKTPNLGGTISAFFLYQLVPTRNDRNDEIDIEILNGTNQILFSTYIDAQLTNPTQQKTLPFDPSDDFHDYRIEWSLSRVRFLVKETDVQAWTLMHEFSTGVPRNGMYVMVNTWWPTWLNGSAVAMDHMLEIDRIIY